MTFRPDHRVYYFSSRDLVRLRDLSCEISSLAHGAYFSRIDAQRSHKIFQRFPLVFILCVLRATFVLDVRWDLFLWDFLWRVHRLQLYIEFKEFRGFISIIDRRFCEKLWGTARLHSHVLDLWLFEGPYPVHERSSWDWWERSSQLVNCRLKSISISFLE